MRSNYINRFGVLFLLVAFLLPLFASSAPVAAAATINIKSVNYATLEVTHDLKGGDVEKQQGRYILVANKFETAELIFTFNGQDKDDSCTSQIILKVDNNTGITNSNKAEVKLKKRDTNGGRACSEEKRKDIKVDNLGSGAFVWFNWVDSATIEPVGLLPYVERNNLRNDRLKLRQPAVLKKQPNDTFNNGGGSDARCADYLDNVSGARGKAHIANEGGSGSCDDDYNITRDIEIGNVQNANVTAGTGTSTINPGGSVTPQKPTCESKSGPLSWFTCPIVDMLDSVTSTLDSLITSQLTVDDRLKAPELEQTWRVLRNIAYIILVPMLLVMVIGTAIEMGPFDAYTVKKALPRLVAAILFIALSWDVTHFFVNLSNIVGNGILGLMTSAFSTNGQAIALGSLFEGGGAEGFFSSLAAGLGTGIAVASGAVSIGIVLSYALVAAAALFIGFLVLIVRQIFIVLLVIVAPLAILAWIFPGNDKFWKTWRTTFISLLLMFPIIMALVASGRIFATIFSNTGDGLLSALLTITAYVAPYFFIPATFKLAGGAFATIAGIANDRSKGFFDRNRKFRQDKRNELRERAAAGNRFKTKNANKNSFVNRLNTGIQTAALAPSNLAMSRNQTRANIASARSIRDFDAASKVLESDIGKAIGGDDDLLWAVIEGKDDEGIRKSLLARGGARFADPTQLDAAVANVKRFQKEGGIRAARVAAGRAQGGTGTGYNYNGTNDDDMLTTINEIAGDDAALAGRMLAEIRTRAVQSGRHDLGAGGFANTAKIMGKLRTAQANGGWIEDEVIDPVTRKAVIDPATGKAMTARRSYGINEAQRELSTDVLDSNAGVVVSGKLKTVERLAPVMKEQADAVLSGGNKQQVARELASLAGKHDAAAQAAPQNARALADGVLAQNIDVATLGKDAEALLSGVIAARDPAGNVLHNPDGSVMKKTTITYQQAIEHLRTNEDVMTMRREYGAATHAAAAAAAASPPGVPPGAPPPPPVFPGGGPPPGGGGLPSDNRLKRNITPLMLLSNGIQLYSFQYLWSDQVYVGVMAQDLLHTHPAAVILENTGFYSVDYQALGLEMLTINEWQAGQTTLSKV